MKLFLCVALIFVHSQVSLGYEDKKEKLINLLFPNRSFFDELHLREANRRGLRLTPPSDWVAGAAVCSNCRGLDKCNVPMF